MRSKLTIIALLAAALSGGVSHAGVDLNEVGAFLVYPAIVAGTPGQFETYLALVNTGDRDVYAHLAYINGRAEYPDGEPDDTYCFECDFSIPLTPNDTELFVVRSTAFGIQIDTEDGTAQHACPHPYGFLTVNLERPLGTVITDNVLLGSEVVVNYGQGYAFSIPAIPFQGHGGGNLQDRELDFDDVEFSRFPSVIASDFIAPGLDGEISAQVALFTLAFETDEVPFSHCEIEGFDAAENPFSRSFNFGCWTLADLGELHPEFYYGNLGQQACSIGEDCDTHGWFKLTCDVTPQGFVEIGGAVHGALIQIAQQGATVRRNDPNAPVLGEGNLITAATSEIGPQGPVSRPGAPVDVLGGSGPTGPGEPALIDEAAAWARIFYQSVTVGDNVTYQVSGPGGDLDP